MGAKINRLRGIPFGVTPPLGSGIGLSLGWKLDEGFGSVALSELTFESNTSNGGVIGGLRVKAKSQQHSGGPYPVGFSVSGMPATISAVKLKIFSLKPQDAFDTALLQVVTGRFDDIGLLLVGPTGVKVKLMADVGGNNVGDIDLNLDQSAGAMPDGGPLPSGTYRPTVGTNDVSRTAFPANFLAPAPANPYGTTLNDFIGTNPNGNWTLYFMTDRGAINADDPLASFQKASLTITTGIIQNATPAVIGGGSLTGSGTPTMVTGKIGDAVRLEGAEGMFIDEPASNVLSLTPRAPDDFSHEPISIIFWYKPISINISQPCIMMDYGYACFLDSNNRFKVIFDTDADVVEFSATAAVAGTWHFVAFGWNHGAVERRGWVSVNGAPKVYGTNIGAPSPATGPFAVGRYAGSSINFGNANGDFDEIYVWRRELSDQDISFLYNSGSGRTYPF